MNVLLCLNAFSDVLCLNFSVNRKQRFQKFLVKSFINIGIVNLLISVHPLVLVESSSTWNFQSPIPVLYKLSNLEHHKNIFQMCCDHGHILKLLPCKGYNLQENRNQNSRIHCDLVNSTHRRAIARIYTAVSLLQSETFDGVVMRTHMCTDLQWCIFDLFIPLTGALPGSVLSGIQTITITTLFFSKSIEIPQPKGTFRAACLSKSAQCQKPNHKNTVLSKPVITLSIVLTRSR